MHVKDRERGMIVSVDFGADGYSRGDWNTELRTPDDRPMGKLPERALDDAIFQANEMRDTRDFDDLREYRQLRAQAIQYHFAQCAKKLIEQIEKDEGWDDWLSKLHRNETTDGV